MLRLERKIAVVTRANSGIDLAMAKTFLDRGAATVYVTGRRKVELGDRAGLSGKKMTAVV
jgi:NADP-dependent 3-hydroxy acid dehydrogenase YdfG